MNSFSSSLVAIAGIFFVTILVCLVSVSESFALDTINRMQFSLKQSRRFRSDYGFIKQPQLYVSKKQNYSSLFAPTATATSTTLASSSNNVVEMNRGTAIDKNDDIDANNLNEKFDAFELIASLTATTLYQR